MSAAINGRDELARAMAPVALELMGEPTDRRCGGNEWRWGSHGSLSVRVDKGVWTNHEDGESGGVLDLLRVRKGLVGDAAFAFLRERNLLPAASTRHKSASGRIVATYDYRAEDGSLLFQVVRKDPKSFPQRRPDGKGGWIWGREGIEPVPYRLPELLVASPDAVVYIVEGEKDVESLRRLGAVATCNPGGAAKPGQRTKWPEYFRGYFAHRDVVVIPDNDPAGAAHAKAVAHNLIGTAAAVRVVELPGLPEKGDVSDWLDAGGSLAQLDALAVRAPEIESTHVSEADPAVATPARTFGNLKLLSVEDALDAPMRTYLLEGLLAPGELSVWWGRPKCGKSFLLLRLAYGLSQGRGMWGREASMVPVLYVAAEGESGIKGRIRALHDALGTAPGFMFIAQRVDLFDPDAALTDMIAAAEAIGAGLVVIDTLARVMGAGDENKTPDMNAFVSNLDRVREEVTTKPHVAVIHHGGWDGNHARGSIALVGAADLVLKVGGEEGGPRSATVEYAKDDAGADVLCFKLDVADLPADAKGRVRSTCLAVEIEASTAVAEHGAPLSEEQRGWLRDIRNMFDEPGIAELRTPRPDMRAGLTLTREQIRNGLRRCGRLEAETDGKLTGKDRQRMSAMLNRLRDKGKIGMTEKLVWLL